MDPRLAEQIGYYRAVAAEYFDDIVKVPQEPAALQGRLRGLGWDIRVSSAGPCYWGEGSVSSQGTHRDAADTGSR